MKKHKLCELLWDASIYPRATLSDVNVSRLAGAVQTECELPPIVVEAGTLRILDGVHRWKALTKILGADAVVDVIERKCKDDNDAFLISIELNASHGMPLTPFDFTRSFVRAEERGITIEMLAKAAHVPPETITRRLSENTGYSRTLGTKMALKGALKALAGTELNEQQLATNKMTGGMRPTYYIHQLQSLIESGLWEWGSQTEKAALMELFFAMQKAMPNAA